jgi:hypothetical protein
MVGPPAAFEGLAAGKLEFLLDRQGDQLMSLVDKNSKFASNARVVDVTGAANGAAAAACVFQVLSVATTDVPHAQRLGRGRCAQKLAALAHNQPRPL